jgi:uncharacterized Zn-binding protein involved in type VI secretion
MSESMQVRTVKKHHLFATVGSLTERGGRVTEATGCAQIDGMTVAVVGDVVTYRDGSSAVIVDGAGFGATSCGKPFALVGSRLDNGDRIINTLQAHDYGVTELEGVPIEGLFDPTYVSPPWEPAA